MTYKLTSFSFSDFAWGRFLADSYFCRLQQSGAVRRLSCWKARPATCLVCCRDSNQRTIAWSFGPGRPGGPNLLRRKVGSAAVCAWLADGIIALESVRSGAGQGSATGRRARPGSLNWSRDILRGGQSRSRNATKWRVFNLLLSKWLYFILFCSGRASPSLRAQKMRLKLSANA